MYSRLLKADLLDLLLISTVGIPISIFVVSFSDDTISHSLLFAASVSIIIGTFVFRDWNQGRTIGKHLFGIKLTFDDENLERKKYKYAKRNLELAFEMAFNLFLFRYRSRLRSINKKYGVTVKPTSAKLTDFE